MRYSEIANRAGKSVGSVKMDASRGKFEKGNLESEEKYILGFSGNTQPLAGVIDPESEKIKKPAAPKTPIRNPSSIQKKPTPSIQKKPAASKIGKGGPEGFVDTHTKSDNKGWEGSREHLLTLPVGTVYRGFLNITVTIMEDPMGNKYFKMMPKALGPWVKDKR